MFRPLGSIVLPFSVKKSLPGLTHRVSAGKDFFGRDQLHFVSSMATRGQEIFCGYGRFIFGVRLSMVRQG